MRRVEAVPRRARELTLRQLPIRRRRLDLGVSEAHCVHRVRILGRPHRRAPPLRDSPRRLLGHHLAGLGAAEEPLPRPQPTIRGSRPHPVRLPGTLRRLQDRRRRLLDKQRVCRQVSPTRVLRRGMRHRLQARRHPS